LCARRADALIPRIDCLPKALAGRNPVDPASLKDDEDRITFDRHAARRAPIAQVLSRCESASVSVLAERRQERRRP
jgi:hypothetical protein